MSMTVFPEGSTANLSSAASSFTSGSAHIGDIVIFQGNVRIDIDKHCRPWGFWLSTRTLPAMMSAFALSLLLTDSPVYNDLSSLLLLSCFL